MSPTTAMTTPLAAAPVGRRIRGQATRAIPRTATVSASLRRRRRSERTRPSNGGEQPQPASDSRTGHFYLGLTSGRDPGSLVNGPDRHFSPGSGSRTAGPAPGGLSRVSLDRPAPVWEGYAVRRTHPALEWTGS